MKIVISPAKTLDFESPLPTKKSSLPKFLDEAEKINALLSHKSKKTIKELMGISDALASLNYARYKAFSLPFTSENARPAVYAFAGDVYMGLDAYSLSQEKTEILQNNLRILSGMYGLLRPLDLIQPYRLEMGTPLKVNRKKNLYEFWAEKLTKGLNEESKPGEFLLNLASVEYFKAINPQKLKAEIISPVFKDLKNGELKIISFFAKKARGSMARFAIESEIETLDGIQSFNKDGYLFSEKHTENPNEPVFIR